MKKLIALLLCSAMLLSFPAAAYAYEDNVEIPFSDVSGETPTATLTEPTQPTTEASSATEPTTATTASVTTTEPATDPAPVYSGEIGNGLSFSFNKTTGELVISGDGAVMNNFGQGKAPWFSYAAEIKTVSIKADKLTNISSYAFEGLSALKSFSVSEKITSIGQGAFKGTALESITFDSNKTTVYADADTIPEKAVIRCHNPSGAYTYAKKFKRQLYVFVSSIDHEDKNEILMIGEKYTVNATITPSDASNKKLTWYSDKKDIASVNSEGVVTAKKAGVCYIYAKSIGEKTIESTDMVKIIVTDYKFSKMIQTKNNCYKKHSAIAPKGIVVHSTGVNNTNAYKYTVNWNTARPGGHEVAVHGFLGKGNNGKVQFYQALPFEMACWGVGSGTKGSYNFNPGYIQFECCEDNLNNRSYFNQIYNNATDLCAYLCLKYNFSYKNVVSHREANLKGYGSAHGDIDHWLQRFGTSMKKFRKTVKAKINAIDPNADLTSGTKNPTHKLTKDAKLYTKAIADDYGTSSKIKESLKKTNKIKFIYDCGNGWSRVKHGKIKGYIRNDKFKRDYLSVFAKKKLRKKANLYTKPTAKKKFKAKSLSKGTKVKIVSVITKGKKKGWTLITRNKKDYYIKTKYHKK